MRAPKFKRGERVIGPTMTDYTVQGAIWSPGNDSYRYILSWKDNDKIFVSMFTHLESDLAASKFSDCLLEIVL